MKRFAFALSLVAATAFAAPLAAQSGSGPWWDPSNTGGRSGSTERVDNRNGSVYDRDGRVSSSRADGQWRRTGSDGNGNTVYVRTRYDSNGNLIQERARRDTLGRYRVFDRRVVQSGDRRNGTLHRGNDRNNDGYEDHEHDDDRNDRWDRNNGHDNGKHNGQYKDKDKNNNKGKHRG